MKNHGDKNIMTEKRTKLQPEMVRMYCDTCGKGQMIAIGQFPTDPPTFQHVCDNCKTVETYEVGYPYVDYVEEPKKLIIT